MKDHWIPRKWQPVWAAVLVPALLLAIWFLMRSTGKLSLDEQARVFDVVSKIATISALVVGSAWSYQSFFRQRLGQPKLNVDQEVHILNLGKDRTLARVSLTLENIGQVRIKASEWSLRAEQLIPFSDSAKRLAESDGSFNDAQARWRTVAGGREKLRVEVSLEPGEKDMIAANLAWSSGPTAVLIYSYLHPETNLGGEFGRPSETLVELDSDGKWRIVDERRT